MALGSLRRMRTVVVLPTFNERENVAGTLAAVRGAVPDADVLVVDDNSPDGTASVVEEVAADLGQIKLLRRPGKQGLGSAYREGFSVGARRRLRDDRVDGCRRLARPGGAAATATPDRGRRRRGHRLPLRAGWGDGRLASHRRLLSRWGNRYTSFVLGLQVRDCTSGYRAYRAESLRAIAPVTTTAEGYAFLTELVRRLVRRGERVMETPIVFIDRRYGQSKMSSRIVLESMVLVTRWGVRDAVTTPARGRVAASIGLTSRPAVDQRKRSPSLE